MPVLPDTDSAVTDYGAPFNDYLPVEDPTTDQSAAQYNKMAASCAAATHTVTRAILTFQGLTYTSGTQTIAVVTHDAVWGNSVLVAPTATQTAIGVYNFTWPASITDELGNSHTVNFRGGWASFDGSTAQINYTLTKTGSNTFTLRTFVAAAASSLNGVNVNIVLF